MKRRLIICMTVLILPCISYSSPLPDTGQITCRDDTQVIPCPGSGESFFGQDGHYDINTPSYTKLDENGNDLPDDEPWPWAMARDNITGLIWEVKTDDGSIHDKDDTYSRNDAQDVFIAALNAAQFGGHSDWRLPTVKELVSIVNRGGMHPAINTAYFPNTQPEYHWSSTLDVIPSYAWSVTFEDGTAYNLYPDPDDPAHVTAVRGGQCGAFGIFIDNGDGTITDTGTGLMWQQGISGVYTWQEALSYCENLLLAGYDDWRLPNIHELQSLVNYSSYNPAIDTLYFPITGSSFYLSSTTLANYSTPWVVYFLNGWVCGDYAQIYGRGVKAVRGGQCGSFGDVDGDCRIDCIDNCVSMPNGLESGTCTKGAVAVPCVSDEQCGVDGYCSMRQEDADSDHLGDACDSCPDTPNPDQSDTYPPQGNGIGDACDCEGNFNCDEDADVDGSDAFIFKIDFGRSSVQNPCTAEASCNGDFNCDHDCDGTDAFLFKQDFGRSPIVNPCPRCFTGPWCRY